MQTLNDSVIGITSKIPWNKGKLLGVKPPLQSKQVWAIRTKLQVDHRLRDLAMFNLAIDSKLRGCDLVSLKIEDGHPVKFELTEQTREAVDPYLKRFGRKRGEVMFTNRCDGRPQHQMRKFPVTLM